MGVKRTLLAEVQGKLSKSQSLYHHSASEVQSLIKESEPLLAAYKGKGLWAELLNMENELSKLGSSAHRELDNLLTLPVLIDDQSLNRMVQRTTAAAYVYFFGLSIHRIVLEVQNQMDFVEKFYKNVDELGEDFRRHIHMLLEIIDKNSFDPDAALKELE